MLLGVSDIDRFIELICTIIECSQPQILTEKCINTYCFQNTYLIIITFSYFIAGVINHGIFILIISILTMNGIAFPLIYLSCFIADHIQFDNQ